MHFAAASPGGVLGLFADPADGSPAARWAPRGARARYLEAPRAIADVDDATIFAALATAARARAHDGGGWRYSHGLSVGSLYILNCR